MQRSENERSAASSPMGGSVLAALSELAPHVQKERTASAVLRTAGEGVLRVGMRLYAFQVSGPDLVLRYLATAPSRLAAIERAIGRPLEGLCAPMDELDLALDVVKGRRILHREKLDLLHSFVRRSTGFDPSSLDASPETAGIDNGVLAPIFVHDEPWGLLGLASRTLTEDDANAVALFATHVGSALEVAEYVEALERSNEELARTQRDLVERERLAALGELAAVVAHEVRNPLGVLYNAISGLREFLKQGAPLAKMADAGVFVSIAREESDRLNRIVSDLLDFARPHPPDLRVESLLPVLESVVAAAPDRRVLLDVPGDLPLVNVDTLYMRQSLLNLVLNGLQAIDNDGSITIRARREAAAERESVRIDVIDDGPGIPSNVRDRIFTPFFTTKPKGTGLGLAVVKRVVDSHGGDLAVESSPGGTTFTVRLPAAFAP